MMKPRVKEESPLLQMADIETEILYVKEAAQRGVLSPAERETIMAGLIAQLREIDEKLFISTRFSGRDIGDIDREMLLNKRRRWEEKYGLPALSPQDADWALPLLTHIGSKEIH